ncbi:MAG: hypothetical protein U0835_07735 [Isosphaeraceae bacterium]
MRLSPTRSWPLGLLGMFVLAGAVEYGFARYESRFTNLSALQWKEANRRVKLARGSHVVAMGDSLVSNAVFPAVLEPHLGPGRTAHNLALGGSPFPVTYFLFRRLLAEGPPPEAVLVDGQMLTFPCGPGSQGDSLPWASVLKFRDLVELSWSFGNRDFFAKQALHEALPSLRSAPTLRARVTSLVTGAPFVDPEHLWIYALGWNENKGGQVLRDPPAGRPRARPDHEPGLLGKFRGEWKCDALQAEYVEKFLALAEVRGVKVYWLVMPADPVLTRAREADGFWRGYAEFLKGHQSRRQNLTVVDAHEAAYPEEFMSDVLHITRTAAVAFSDSLGEVLSRGGATPRWVVFPRYDAGRARELAASVAVPDMETLSRRLTGNAPRPAESIRR